MEFTRHALERMCERGIGKATVSAILKHGEKTCAGGGRLAYTDFGYVVVTCPRDETVITVYCAEEFSPAWSKKKAVTKRRQTFRKQLRDNRKHSGGNW